MEDLVSLPFWEDMALLAYASNLIRIIAYRVNNILSEHMNQCEDPAS